VRARLAASRQRDYTSGDRLKEQLFAMGVRIDDREKTWSASGGGGGGGGGYGGGGGFGGLGHDYTRQPGDNGPVDVNQVNDILKQRNDAKRARDFNLADQLRCAALRGVPRARVAPLAPPAPRPAALRPRPGAVASWRAHRLHAARVPRALTRSACRACPCAVTSCARWAWR
jgi:hypothetical protein